MHIAGTEQLERPQAKIGIMPFVVMMAGLASQSMLFSLPAPLLPAMAHDFGANGPFIAQMVFALASLGLMFTSISSGLIVRLTGVRPLLILSSGLYALAGLIPWLTSSVPVLLGSRLLVGGACGLLTTACTMLLAHSYSGAARSRALGFQTSLGSVTGLAALLIGGGSVQAFGWHPAFLAYGVFALPVVLLSMIGVPPVPLSAPVAHMGMGLALARTWPVCIAGCLLMMVPLMVGSDVPFVLTAIGVGTPIVHSIVLAMVTIFSAVSGAVFGRVQVRLGVKNTFAASLLLSALGMLLIGLASAAWMAGLGCILVGFGLGFYIPHLWVLSTTLVPESMRGHAIGLLTTSMFLGGFLYPFLVGGLQKAFGLGGALASIAVLLALAAASAMVFARARLSGGAIAVAA